MIPGGTTTASRFTYLPGATLVARAPKHRAPLPAALVSTRAHPADFVPRHCAGSPDGTTCMHDHPGDKPRWGWFPAFLRARSAAS